MCTTLAVLCNSLYNIKLILFIILPTIYLCFINAISIYNLFKLYAVIGDPRSKGLAVVRVAGECPCIR